jgi:hypothetical protein
MLKKIIISLLILICVFLCGCTTPLPEKTGSIAITSSPSGAEVYFDKEYHGTTPGTINAVAAGNHSVEIRKNGYITWFQNITVISGTTVSLSPVLMPSADTIPPLVPTFTPSVTKKTAPEIHVDGFWTYPAVRSYSNPVSLLVHAEGDNVGTADARIVTSSANMYYNDQQLCWVKIYFGTIKAGGHATTDTMMYCSLPAGADDHDFVIKFENVIVTP